MVEVELEIAEQARICLDINPADVRFFENLMVALMQVYRHANPGESKQAVAEMLRHLRAERQRNPDFGKANSQWLLIHLIQLQAWGPYPELRDSAEALACAERLRELLPDDDQALMLLGWAKYRMQDWRSAPRVPAEGEQRA